MVEDPFKVPKNERASELLDLTEFNLRLSHFSLTRPRQPLPPEYLDSRALIVLVKGPRSLRNIIPVVHLFFQLFLFFSTNLSFFPQFQIFDGFLRFLTGLQSFERIPKFRDCPFQRIVKERFIEYFGVTSRR